MQERAETVGFTMLAVWQWGHAVQDETPQIYVCFKGVGKALGCQFWGLGDVKSYDDAPGFS